MAQNTPQRTKYLKQWRLDNFEKRKKYNEQWKLNNPIKTKEQRIRSRERRKRFIKEIKTRLFYIRCGENHISCLDFHHRDPTEKDKSVSYLVFSSSRRKVLEEISKCDVLCANCHRKEHWEGEDFAPEVE